MPKLVDLQGHIILEGNKGAALSYGIGICKALVMEDKYIYESEANGKQISWLKMIGASTDRQKVGEIVK